MRWVGDFFRWNSVWSTNQGTYYQALNSPANSNYQWIAYYATTNQFYLTNTAFNRVDVYSFAMSYLSNIAVSSGVGQGIGFYNSMMYIPNTSGQVQIINPTNGAVSNTITISQCSGTLGQITFDSSGNYAIACYTNSKVVLYSNQNTYQSTLTVDSKPQQVMVDDVGRFVVATYGAVDIFY